MEATHKRVQAEFQRRNPGVKFDTHNFNYLQEKVKQAELAEHAAELDESFGHESTLVATAAVRVTALRAHSTGEDRTASRRVLLRDDIERGGRNEAERRESGFEGA